MKDRFECCIKYYNQYPTSKIPIVIDLLPQTLKNIICNQTVKKSIETRYGSFEKSINAEDSYAAWPERLYIVRNKTIVYKGGTGPSGYKLDEVEQYLKTLEAHQENGI